MLVFMLYVVVPVLSLGILWIIYNIVSNLRSDRQKRLEEKACLDKSMEEDYFTDPDTGRKFTLEEAEQGIDLSNYNQVRSDGSIMQQFFNEDEREAAFIKNDLLKAGYKYSEEFDGIVPHFLYGESKHDSVPGMMERYQGRYMLLLKLRLGFQQSAIFEYKLVIVFRTKSHLGHVVVWQTDLLSGLGGLLTNAPRKSPRGLYTACYYTPEHKHSHDIIDRVAGTGEELVERLLDELDRYPGYECEIIEDYVYIKATRAASRELLQEVLKAEKSLHARLSDYLLTAPEI